MVRLVVASNDTNAKNVKQPLYFILDTILTREILTARLFYLLKKV
nr:hypothetical protein [Chryseobacterium luquanense]